MSNLPKTMPRATSNEPIRSRRIPTASGAFIPPSLSATPLTTATTTIGRKQLDMELSSMVLCSVNNHNNNNNNNNAGSDSSVLITSRLSSSVALDKPQPATWHDPGCPSDNEGAGSRSSSPLDNFASQPAVCSNSSSIVGTAPQSCTLPTIATGASGPTTSSASDYRAVSPAHSLRTGSSSRLSMTDICRICHCEATLECPLITPCHCAGTLRYVHQKCLQQWIKSSQTRSCEVCRYGFIMQSRVKPIRKWEKLDMTNVERRKILCSVTFHVIAITCVVWSLYVLIERTADEIRQGQLDWPFWTKLVVVAIGFTGGLVFMYVQCKMYVQLFRRWKAYNKVIFVQDCPENGIRKLASGLTSGILSGANDAKVGSAAKEQGRRTSEDGGV